MLFVCTGNVCRSPLAERWTRARLGDALGADAGRFVVESAGTRALDGHPMDERAAAVLRDLGGTPEGFRARTLTPDLLRDADVVLAATRAHRAAAVTMAPRALRRAFTMREFGRLVTRAGVDLAAGGVAAGTRDPVARARALVAAAAAARGQAPPGQPADDDVTDPIGGTPQLHWMVGVRIANALTPVLDALTATYTAER